MRRYETIYIIQPNLGEDDITAIIDKTNSVIEGAGGHIIQLDRWGLKKLAYLIKKEKQGYYVFSEYAGIPEAVAEIERLFRIDDKVLKYLTVKTQDFFVADANIETEEDSESAEDVTVEETSAEAEPQTEESSEEAKVEETAKESSEEAEVDETAKESEKETEQEPEADDSPEDKSPAE